MSFKKQWFDEIWSVKGNHLINSFKPGNLLKAHYVIGADGQKLQGTISIFGGSGAEAAAKLLVEKIAEQISQVALSDHAILAVEWID